MTLCVDLSGWSVDGIGPLVGVSSMIGGTGDERELPGSPGWGRDGVTGKFTNTWQ